MKFDDFFEDVMGRVIQVLLIVFLVILFGLLPLQIFREARASKVCARAGYPKTKFVWSDGFYCVKRQNQTDEIIPIDEVSSERR